MPSDNQPESLSIDETNALRIKLGLKPLYNDITTADNSTNDNTNSNNTKYSADTDVTYVAPVIESKKAIEIEKRLNERLNHKARSQLIKGPSLAQSLNEDPLDPLVWAQRQRNKQKLASKQNFVTYSDDEISPNDHNHDPITDHSLDPQAQLKVVHDYNNLDTNSVLTLCDTGILEAQDEGHDDIDYLQSTDLADKEKIQKNNSIKKDKPISYQEYVSKAMDDTGDRNILEKYDEVIQENEGSSFKNFIKGFFINTKKTNVADNLNDTEILIGKSVTNSNTNSSNHTSDIFKLNGHNVHNSVNTINNKIIKKTIPKISKRSKVPNWDMVFNDSTPTQTNESSTSPPLDNTISIPIIKPRILMSNDTPTDDIDNKLYQQLTKQRRIARSVQSQMNNVVKLENIKQDHYEVKYEISQVDEFCKYVEPTNNNNNNTYSKYKSTTQSNDREVVSQTTVETTDMNPLEEQPLDCGIANTLKYLKTKGQLEPVNSENDDIKLNYINKYGKTMTPREAFKELCYSFHGKLPGKKKQEKRLRKIEMELRMLQNPTDSLPTMRALIQNQKSDKCAHIILDGGSNIMK